MKEKSNPLWWGADRNGLIDSAAAFQSAIDAISDGGLLYIPPGSYFVDGPVVISDKNINIDCKGTIILSDNPDAYIKFESTQYYSLSGTALSVLPKIGDSALSWASPPIIDGDPSSYFFLLMSDEEEIVRVGNAAYTPYKKNEAGEISSYDWSLRAGIKLDYTDAALLSIQLIQKRSPVTVSGLRVKFRNISGASSKTYRLYLNRASSITFTDLSVDSTDLNIPGSAVSISRSVGIDFKNSVPIGPSNSLDDSYAFNVFLSAFVSFDGCRYDNPLSSHPITERGYAARHGANISFYNCRFAGIDDHYGHDYFIENCVFNNRGVSISGGNVTIKNCKQIGPTGTLFELRSDAPYAYGTLRIDGCDVDAYRTIDMRALSDPLGRSTKVKFFDDVIINNTVITQRNSGPAFNFSMTDDLHIKTKTKHFRASGIVFKRMQGHVACALHYSYDSNRKSWVELAEFIDIDYRIQVKNLSGTWAEVAIVSLGGFEADEMYVSNFRNFIPYQCLNLQKMTAANSSVQGYVEPASFGAQGDYKFNGCDIGVIFVLPSINTDKFNFIDCMVNSNLYGVGTNQERLKAATAYLSRNRAAAGVNLSNLPVGGTLEYYTQ